MLIKLICYRPLFSWTNYTLNRCLAVRWLLLRFCCICTHTHTHTHTHIYIYILSVYTWFRGHVRYCKRLLSTWTPMGHTESSSVWSVSRRDDVECRGTDRWRHYRYPLYQCYRRVLCGRETSSSVRGRSPNCTQRTQLSWFTSLPISWRCQGNRISYISLPWQQLFEFVNGLAEQDINTLILCREVKSCWSYKFNARRP